jgi:copper homeostasis protein (lipoprotein)
MEALVVRHAIARAGLRRLARFLGLGLLTMTAAAGSAGAAEPAVSGQAHYRERIALPPTAVFEAVLEDVSRADAPAGVLGEARVAPAGQVPIRFRIAYDPARIDPARSYAVRARILVDGRLWFTTTDAYRVLTRGQGDQVELLLRRVSQSAERARPGALGALPGTFAGELPCADCPGIRYQLDLLEDGAFFLRRVYLGREPDNVLDEIGGFSIAADGRTLVLMPGPEAPVRFAIRDRDTLTLLDLEGREIVSELNYDLTRRADFPPLMPRLAMRGMYQYLADAGRFTECLTRLSLPVAQEADNVALERAYGEARRQPGEELLVTLEGQIALRPKMEGGGKELALVPHRLLGVWPGETCGAGFDTAPLENSYWKLTRLGDAPVLVGGRQREPHLILRPHDGRFGGSGGCNRLIGSYRVDGNQLELSQAATTMMACPEGMETEAAFTAALPKVKTWRVIGEHLELYDANDAFLARFERRLMP